MEYDLPMDDPLPFVTVQRHPQKWQFGTIRGSVSLFSQCNRALCEDRESARAGQQDLPPDSGFVLLLLTALLIGYPSRSQDLVEIMRVMHGGLSMPMLSKHSTQGIVSIMDSR